MSRAARGRRRVRIPLLALGAAAWTLLLTGAVGMHGDGDMAGMAGDMPTDGLAGWVVMVVAMMVPLLTAPVGHVLVRNRPRWRTAAAAGFVLAYLAVWTLAGAALLAVGSAIGGGAGVLGAVVLAVVWQICPVKQRCLNRMHHHPPLAAFGLRAGRDVLRFGIVHGLWCVGSCWAVMLVALVVPDYAIPVMLVLTAWLAAERLARPERPSWRVRGPVKLARAARELLWSTMSAREQLSSSSGGVA